MGIQPPEISRFAGALVDILDKVSYRPVSLTDFSDPVFRLRYEAYRREEFIPLNDLGISTDDLDDVPNAYGFGIYIEDRLVSSLRIHHVTAEHRKSPGMKVYPDILGPMLDRGITFIDPSRFTADFEATLAYPALPFLTLRIAVMASDYFAANYCLATVRPEHLAFYKRVFRAEEFAEVRPYPDLDFSIALYGTNVDETLQTLYQRYPFFRSSPEERAGLFAPGAAGVDASYVKATARAALEDLGLPQPA